MNEETSDELLNQLNLVIEQAEESASESFKHGIVQDEIIGAVENFFYSNLITNYRDNLVENNLKEYNIAENDLKNIKKEFKELFNKCEASIVDKPKKDRIDSKVYQSFRKKLNKISKNAHKFLVWLENYLEIDACEESIAQFKKEIKTLGKKLKIGELEMGEEGGFISVGFE